MTATTDCTDLAAVWCPVHGDCDCPDVYPGDDPGCPLHAPTSTHADDPDDQPPGIHQDDHAALPPAHEAAQRVNAFLIEHGDGIIATAADLPLYARDLAALARHPKENPRP